MTNLKSIVIHFYFILTTLFLEKKNLNNLESNNLAKIALIMIATQIFLNYLFSSESH